MSVKKVFPARLSGDVSVPGDKSVSQRVAMLAALAKGTTVVRGFLMGEDAVSTLRAVCALGASHVFEEDVLKITGTAGKLKEPANPLDMGNSGTGTRLLAGLLAGRPMTVTMTGDASLSRRPMGRICIPLEQMGAQIQLTGEKETLPMTIHGAPLHGTRYELPVASAQVKSCILLAGLYADGKTTVLEPRPTRDHTEKLFHIFGIPVDVNGLEISVQGVGKDGPLFDACEITVPGDFSSAAFWITAAAARPGAHLRVEGVGLNPRRTALLNVLSRMGAQIRTTVTRSQGDPIGTVVVDGAELHGTEVGGDEIPNLIDELPLVAVAGALAAGRTVIRDAAELRVKESDRISVTATHLRSFGVAVDEAPDGMTISGSSNLIAPDNAVDSFGDHRIAMSMAVLTTFCSEPVELSNVECVQTSYPGFWEDLEQLGGKSE